MLNLLHYTHALKIMLELGGRGVGQGGGRTSLIGLNKVWFLGTGYEISYIAS